jgi:hypothetical protein
MLVKMTLKPLQQLREACQFPEALGILSRRNWFFLWVLVASSI